MLALTSAYAKHVLLDEVAKTKDEIIECKRDCAGLASSLCKLKTSILVATWKDIERMKKTSAMLQMSGLGLNTVWHF